MDFSLDHLSEPSLHTVTCAHPGGLHTMAYWQWGKPNEQPVVLLVHGLTRNGRDFDALAHRLSARFCVIAPDMVGRGRSDWLAQPMQYQFPQYVADIVTLVARLNVTKLAWVGTSMGGLIGMLYASMPGHPIARLVLNDIGPVIAEEGRQRIASYVGQLGSYSSFEQAEKALRLTMADFGPHTDAQFRVLSRNYLREANGQWGYHYDPAISVPFRSSAQEPVADLWPLYESLSMPVLVTRGAHSDILSRDTALAMTQRGPRAKLVEFLGVGHAPTLIADDQIDAVDHFLQPF